MLKYQQIEKQNNVNGIKKSTSKTAFGILVYETNEPRIFRCGVNQRRIMSSSSIEMVNTIH